MNRGEEIKIKRRKIRYWEELNLKRKKNQDAHLPQIATLLLTIIVLGCIFAELVMTGDPKYMNLAEISMPPSAAHIFGTDTLGRDIFSMVWYGGRISLFVGILATAISTVIAIVYGCAAGLAGEMADNILMRFTEILMSIPQILLVIFVQAMIGQPTVVSIALVIGLTGFMSVAKMVRSEVKQIRNSDYIVAARTMGGGFFYILWNHLMPNFMSAIMFMIITNLGGAIAMEATLSYLGIGLPTNVISWGTLMSLSQKAMLTGSWWLLLIPGTILVITLICITEIGEYLRTNNRRDRLI